MLTLKCVQGLLMWLFPTCGRTDLEPECERLTSLPAVVPQGDSQLIENRSGLPRWAEWSIDSTLGGYALLSSSTGRGEDFGIRTDVRDL